MNRFKRAMYVLQGKQVPLTLADARMAVTNHKEFWDSRYRWGDIFLDADMIPTMECIDEILFQLDKLQTLEYDTNPEGVEEYMAKRWAESRASKPVHGRERRSYAPSITGRKPTPWPYVDEDDENDE